MALCYSQREATQMSFPIILFYSTSTSTPLRPIGTTYILNRQPVNLNQTTQTKMSEAETERGVGNI